MGTIHILPEEQIEELLRTAIVGRIACCDHGEANDGRPYLVPLAYGYDGESVYAHSGPGRKLEFMRRQPLVTFEVDEAAASDRWRSVVAEGTFEEITDAEARAHALRTIYGDGVIPDLGAQTVVFRIRLTTRSGRCETPD
ncbi:MAG: pyridoxamine 5'-phosphate oxidase family protein [Thermomicrobiales bacterium]|nr:pyridoxamine 5'-phosphate oxidase family protein [Thermomicrobiales bacterium]